MKGDPLETFKKFAKKKLTNFWSWAGLEPVLLLGRPQQILKKIEAEKATLVWQLVEASL